MLWTLMLAMQVANPTPTISVPRPTEIPWDKTFESITIHSHSIPGTEMGIASLQPIQDLDGDGVTDLVVGGGIENWGPQTSHGFVAAYSTAKSARLWIVRGGEQGIGVSDNLGSTVLVITDIDRDGVADVLAGTPSFDDGSGRVLILSGKNGTVLRRISASTLHESSPESETTKDGFGSRLALAGDEDHDGTRDFLIGGRLKSLQGFGLFSAFSQELLRTWDGCLIGCCGDLDSDGASEVLTLEHTDVPRGIVCRIRAGAHAVPPRDLVMLRGMVQAEEVNAVGDLDSDNIQDIAIEMPLRSEDEWSSTAESRRIVVYSPKTGAVLLDFITEVGLGAGQVDAICDAGDLDADAVPDIGVQFQRRDSRSGSAAWIAFHSGHDGRLLARFVDLEGHSAGQNFHFCAFGDTNKNGQPEIAVCGGGAPRPGPAKGLEAPLPSQVDVRPELSDGYIRVFELPNLK